MTDNSGGIDLGELAEKRLTRGALVKGAGGKYESPEWQEKFKAQKAREFE